jgi:hypothetical protein
MHSKRNICKGSTGRRNVWGGEILEEEIGKVRYWKKKCMGR